MFSPVLSPTSGSSLDSSPSLSGSPSPDSTISYHQIYTQNRTHTPSHSANSAIHPHALMRLLEIGLSRPVIEYIVDCVSETVTYALERSPCPRTSRGRSHARSTPRQQFTYFVASLLARARVSPSTLLVALVYITRARPHIVIGLPQYALERIFLGALVVANKYTLDAPLKNVHWALCTDGLFGAPDVGSMEREFLNVLDWQLGVQEMDLLAHRGLLAAEPGFSGSLQPMAKECPRPPHLCHRRRSSACTGSVPELEPPSPQSSTESMSPRTPLSAVTSPYELCSFDHTSMADVPMDVGVDMHAEGPPPTKRRGRSHGLLWPFPGPHTVR
ncbi:hypothetical protein DFH07DRAFT_731757 [Mycena maculata]|uniref:Cyclin N-terminal domain-containing protein n=1 Tax=Mycena maculata TaxID=230809 RepID=A0AAD7K6D1_9AGAR|nr:hypothetical protein DFH07DRAFT_731757 [Mycena maculata]